MKKFLIIIILTFFNLSCGDIVNGVFDDMTQWVPLCVDSGASPGGDGRGWGNAVPGIGEALALVKEGGEIWVKSGVYDVSEVIVIDNTVEKISIYGGFAGIESRRDERDASVNVTILNSPGDNGIIAFTGARSVTLEGIFCSGSGNPGNNSAVTIDSSHGIVFRSCVFDSFIAAGSGRVFDITGSGVTIENSAFSNNTSGGDGCALYTVGSDVTILGCSFKNNVASGNGGAIYTGSSAFRIDDSVLSGNYTNTGYSGGALYVTESEANIGNCTFEKNGHDGSSVVTNNGGAISAVEGATVNISQSNFSDNKSKGGGAIYTHSSTLNIDDSVLSGNYTGAGYSGGAFYVTESEVNIGNCTFEKNGYDGFSVSTADGGAIYTAAGSEVKISGSDLSNNKANNDGGALHADGSKISIANNSRFGNNSAGSGGAIFANANISMTISDTELTNNETIYNGGAVNLDNSSAEINNSTLSENYTSSSGSGGALSINTGNTNILNSKFLDNGYNGSDGKTVNGGAIYSDSGSLSIIGAKSEISSNCASGSGGGIYVNSGSLTIHDATIANNGYISGGIPITGSGGGIVFRGDSLTIKRGVFLYNKAKVSGGGIFIDSSNGTVDINAGRFKYNSAGNYTGDSGTGGAIFITGSFTIVMVNSLFFDNKVYNSSGLPGYGGGAVFNDTSSLITNTYANLTFYSNHASGNNSTGGAFYSKNGKHNFYNSVFYNNTAALSTAGNIHLENGTIEVYYCFYNGGLSGDVGLMEGNIDNSIDIPFASTTNGESDFLYPADIIIDAGSNSYVPIEITADVAGSLRFIDISSVTDTGNGTTPIVDIGAYEGQ